MVMEYEAVLYVQKKCVFIFSGRDSKENTDRIQGKI